MMSLFVPANTRLHTLPQHLNRVSGTSVVPQRLNKWSRAVVVTTVILAALVACTSTGLTPVQQAQLDALNTLKSVRAVVVAGVGVFNTGYQSGQFNDSQRTQLGNLYNKYLAADAVAATTLQATTSTDPNQIVGNVLILASEVLKFVQTLKTGAP